METRTRFKPDPISDLIATGQLATTGPICILGLDCGYGAPGLSVVNVTSGSMLGLEFLYGECIQTERSEDRQSVAYDDCMRISAIGRWLRQQHDRWTPDIVVMEIPFSGARGAMAIKGMAFATALSISVADSYFKCKVLQLCSPYDTKKWCTGNTKAEKEEMIRAAQSYFPDVPWPMQVKNKKKMDLKKSEAIADSLAAILTFLRLPPKNAPVRNRVL